ncbi:tripartite tricarboxylate transporter TctB family protein [Hoeflea sp. CAU 1731]
MRWIAGIDVLTGLVIAGFGIGVSTYAYAKFPTSGFDDLGPGLFPLLVGILLTCSGIVIGVQGALKNAEALHLTWSRAFIILFGILSFIGVVSWFGLVPAIGILVVISSLASAEYIGFVKSCALAVFLCLFVYLIFSLGLGQHVEYFTWLGA